MALASSAPARADENLLHGPHPFLKENELALHVLIASGSGDSMSGGKLAFDYGFKLTGGWIPLWLDLALNYPARRVQPIPQPGRVRTELGRSVRDAGRRPLGVRDPHPAGAVRRRRRRLRLRVSDRRVRGAGPMLRGVGGANYFFFDWLGVGGQVGFSLGTLGYDNTFMGSHTYQVFDVGGGLVFQF